MPINLLRETKNLERISEYICKHVDDFKGILEDAVAFPSISTDPDYRNPCVQVVRWAVSKLRSLDFEVEEVQLVPEMFIDGKVVQRPPIILATLGNDPEKSTLCYVGFLDVCPVIKKFSCDEDNFMMTEVDGCLFGKGVMTKAETLCWLNAVHIYKELNVPFPCNLKILLECLSHHDNFGLEALLRERKTTFFSDVDATCSSSFYWLDRHKPALIYGILGLCQFHISVSTSMRSNNMLNNCMADILYLLDSLVDREGKILIPGINSGIAAFTEAEQIHLSNVKFHSPESHRKTSDFFRGSAIHKKLKSPHLSIHEIFTAPKSTKAPKTVYAKFSIRIVPGQNSQNMERIVTSYLKGCWERRKSRNKFSIHIAGSSEPYIVNWTKKEFKALIHTSKFLYQTDPDYLLLEGTRNHWVSMLERETGKEFVGVPLFPQESDPHSGHEKIHLKDYLQAIKILCTYINKLPTTLSPEQVSKSLMWQLFIEMCSVQHYNGPYHNLSVPWIILASLCCYKTRTWLK